MTKREFNALRVGDVVEFRPPLWWGEMTVVHVSDFPRNAKVEADHSASGRGIVRPTIWGPDYGFSANYRAWRIVKKGEVL